MLLTRSFKELVQRRVAADPAFGDALRRERIDAMLVGKEGKGHEQVRQRADREPDRACRRQTGVRARFIARRVPEADIEDL
jgi:hypothetical protein